MTTHDGHNRGADLLWKRLASDNRSTWKIIYVHTVVFANMETIPPCMPALRCLYTDPLLAARHHRLHPAPTCIPSGRPWALHRIPYVHLDVCLLLLLLLLHLCLPPTSSNSNSAGCVTPSDVKCSCWPPSDLPQPTRKTYTFNYQCNLKKHKAPISSKYYFRF